MAATQGNATQINGVPVEQVDPANGEVLQYNSSTGQYEPTAVAGTGDVTSAANLTDNSIVLGDGGGKGVKTSVLATDGSGSISGIVNLTQSGYTDIAEISTPANPAANNARFYSKDDGGTTKLYFRDSAGSETELGAGGGASFVDKLQVYYVGKHGNDSNDGKVVDEAFLTIGAAITAATGDTPSATNRFRIDILDAGKYNENITAVQYVDIHGPNATVEGAVNLADDMSIRLYQATRTGSTCVAKGSGTGDTYVHIDEIIVTGAGNAVTNFGTSSLMHVRADKIMVETGTAIGSSSTASGHMHLDVGDVYISGNSGVGIAITGGNSIVGRVDHILELGSPTTTEALDVTNGTIDLNVSTIATDSAYTVETAGILNLNCNELSGTQTVNGSGTVTLRSDKVTRIKDDATLAPLNITERASEPSSPIANDIYLDDGTNTASTDPGWRRYTGSAWEDISASAGGGGTPGGADTQIQYNNGGAFGGEADLTWNDSTKDLTLGASTATAQLFLPSNSDSSNQTLKIGTSGIYENASGELSLTGGTSELLRLINDTANSLLIPENDIWLSQTDNAGTGVINLFKDNTSDEIEVGAALTNLGSFEFEEDSGVVTHTDMAVSATPSDGDEMSYTFRIDANNILKVKASADGAGGVDELAVVLAAQLINSVESITATSAGVAADADLISTHITTNGDSDLDNVTLVDGHTAGQRKVFVVKAVGNAADSVKITPTTLVGGTQITFSASPLGLGCEMEWTSAGWVISSNNGGTLA